ncbi:MAG TPA: hypothetical protein ENK57_03880 [Polyangiaceae bacterium]|nr:hypothetical protein [Polyangiaceae bacterium]
MKRPTQLGVLVHTVIGRMHGIDTGGEPAVGPGLLPPVFAEQERHLEEHRRQAMGMGVQADFGVTT